MSSGEDFSKKYEGFNKKNIARFVIANHFKKDFVLKVLTNLSKNQGDCFFLYAVYEHEENYTCIRERKTFERNKVYLTLRVSLPHKHYLLWCKQRSAMKRKTCISDLNFYKRMTSFQHQWIEWLYECPECAPWWGLLFNLEKEVISRPSRTSFKRLKRTRCSGYSVLHEHVLQYFVLFSFTYHF